MMEYFTFSEIIEFAKQGKRVARDGWNGARMFAYYVPAGEYPARVNAIKGVFTNDVVPYRAYWALKTAQDDVAIWTPSNSDIFADDWFIVD